MRILITHSKDLFKLYFNNWLERLQSNNELHVIEDEENQNVVCTTVLPSINDILIYINSFISYQKKTNNGNILKYYFIIDAFKKLSKFLKECNFKFAINIKRLYEIFVKAIKKRINNQIFYRDNVESLSDDDLVSLNNLFNNIGKNNVIMFAT